MSPLQIEILLHYYTRPTDYRDRDFSAPAVESALNGFLSNKMIAPTNIRNPKDGDRVFMLTPKAHFYLEHLLNIPLPVEETRFRIPTKE